MTFKQRLYSILAPVFDGEIYPVRHPDPDGSQSSVASLFGIYLVVGGQSLNKLDGDCDLSRPRVQVSIYGIDSNEVDLKQVAVTNAMKAANAIYNQCVSDQVDYETIDGALPNVSVSVPVDGYEDNSKRFFVHSDFYAWSSNV